MSTTAVELPLPASEQLSDEMWVSLVGLLRSHVAMHQVARPKERLRIDPELDGSVVELLGSQGRLSLLAPNAEGWGTAEFRPESAEAEDEYGMFSFTADGLLQFAEAEPVELEAAVEYLLNKVVA